MSAYAFNFAEYCEWRALGPAVLTPREREALQLMVTADLRLAEEFALRALHVELVVLALKCALAFGLILALSGCSARAFPLTRITWLEGGSGRYGQLAIIGPDFVSAGWKEYGNLILQCRLNFEEGARCND
jgi:hypothetical protein